MSAATIPLPSAQSKKPWQPSSRDKLVFKWIKFEGKTQSQVARDLDLNQSTVSRIIQRYERWLAHGGPQQVGELSHAERIRYQRWITYERNELLLNSCIRLAEEMERAYDTSESTTQYPQGYSSHETKVRTKLKCIDRTGGACRYLRLAFRINMEQQKLMEKDDLPPLQPLCEADLDPDLDQEGPDLFKDQEARRAREGEAPAEPQTRSASEGNAQARSASEGIAASTDSRAVVGSPDPIPPPTEGLPAPDTRPSTFDFRPSTTADSRAVVGSPDPTTPSTEGLHDQLPTTHKTHTHAPAHATATPYIHSTYAPLDRYEKNSSNACIGPFGPPPADSHPACLPPN